MATKVHLIIGSTRQNRAADKVAEWVKAQVAKRSDVELAILDLKEENLPFFEAAVPPAYMPDPTDHGQAWTAKVGSAERFIFLTSEYNRSIPASLKNAIDYMVKEWNGKPAAIVSYGYVDGGANATQHLRDILGWVKVNVMPTATHLKFAQEMFDESSQLKDAAASFADNEATFAQMLDELVAAEVTAA